MSQLFVDNIKKNWWCIGFPTGVVVTGVITATTFKGNLTGGSVSGTTGSFSGNVSIGGTLTYEDVSNVDVVGVITAREGIRLGRVGFGATIGPAIGAGIVLLWRWSIFTKYYFWCNDSGRRIFTIKLCYYS